MQYRIVALFAMTAVAIPVNVHPSDDLIGDLGLRSAILGNGDSTGVQNAKRSNSDDDPIGDLISDSAGLPTDSATSAEDLVSDLGLRSTILGNGDSTGVKNAKRALAEENLIGPFDVGIPVVDPDVGVIV